MGSLLGGFLARMGDDVALLGRKAHLDAIERNGLKVSGLWGEFRSKTFETYTTLSEIPAAKRHFDLAIITVKSYDTAAAARELAAFLPKEAVILSFQNGLGNIDQITAVFSPDRVLAGRIITGVEVTEPGAVNVTVSADDLLIGALPGARPKFSPAAAANLFRLARVPARAVDNILLHIWLKVIYNCALNAPCALRKIPYGKLLQTDADRAAIRRIVDECYAVAAKSGMRLDPPDSAGYWKLLVETLIPRTATHYPSMLRDIEKGKKTEINAMNGAVWHLGESLGVPAPENQSVTEQIQKACDKIN